MEMEKMPPLFAGIDEIYSQTIPLNLLAVTCYRGVVHPAGDYKEMSSILVDQIAPLVYESKCGGGEVAGSRPMRTAVHIT
jgi:hypothetical protein